MTPDISIILNVHNESVYLQRTLLSLAEAASFAAAAGATLELIMVLDAPPQETLDLAHVCVDRDYLMFPYRRVHIEVVQNRCPGLSRNDGIALARGEYIALSDADDLISFNLLLASLERSRDIDRPGIVFPEYIVEFGERRAIVRCRPLADITPLSMLQDHPYSSRAFGPRRLFVEIPFRDARISEGFAHEDWHFNCEIVGAGYDLTTAADTILFYRKRESTRSKQTAQLSAGQIRQSRLFFPQCYLDVCRAAYEALRQKAEYDYPCPNVIEHDSGRRLAELPFFQELFIAANRIDPEVDPSHYYDSAFWSPAHVSVRTGFVYYKVCTHIGSASYDDVFLLPYMVSGGAEKYLISVMEALLATGLSRRCLVICGESTAKRAWIDRLPSGTDLVDLPEIDPELSEHGRDVITLKLLQVVAPDARIHLKGSAFACEFYRKYRHMLKNNKTFFYKFTDDRRLVDGRLVIENYFFGFLSDCLNSLDGIISDHKKSIDEDRRRFGVWPSKWHCLPAPCQTSSIPTFPREDNKEGSLRLLWASRLDGQKRPGLVADISRACAALGVQVSIDMFGTVILGGFEIAELRNTPMVRYCGPFTDFTTLPLREYDGLLYTSMYDGMPNVVLEAMAAGLPPIAPAIDGIPEVVRDGETGLLVPNLVDSNKLAEAYADRIAAFQADPALRRRMSEACIDLIRCDRSRNVFEVRVRELFGE